MNDLVAICREVDKESGQIAVYPINAPVTKELLMKLSIRRCMNPELRYFVTFASDWKDEKHKNEIKKALLRKDVTRAIDAMGRIAEV